MLADLAAEAANHSLERPADHRDRAMSILTGIAGNISIPQQRPVNFTEFELVSSLTKR